MTSVLVNTLRLGIFQLDFLDDVPPSAILNTSTTLARKCGHEGLAKYTTAVLRAHLRNKESSAKDSNKESAVKSAEELSNHYSMPLWIVERWLKNYGFEDCLSMLKHALSNPKMYLRVNETAITTEGLLNVFASNNIKAQESKIVPNCLNVTASKKQKGGFESYPGYSEGLFSVQDAAASLVSQIVAPEKEDYVIDLCAAPGGKTAHLAELMDNTGEIVAVDIYEKRLNLLRQTMDRLSLTNIKLVVEDGTKFKSDRLADKVLIDAPCSGTGVFNRRSDSKYRRKESDIKELQTLQLELLENAASLLKPGGILVYSTCSVEPEENSMVIDSFIEKNNNFKLDDLSKFLSDTLKNHSVLSVTAKTGKVQLLPSIFDLSGFFIARLVKSSH